MAKKSADKTLIKSSRIQTSPGNNSIGCNTSPLLSYIITIIIYKVAFDHIFIALDHDKLKWCLVYSFFLPLHLQYQIK